MKSHNEQILIGLLLKAQSMTPLCLILVSNESQGSLSALAASLMLAFLLSVMERTLKPWTIIGASAFATSIFTLGDSCGWRRPNSFRGYLPTTEFFKQQFSLAPYSSPWEHSWGWFAIGRDQTITQRLDDMKQATGRNWVAHNFHPGQVEST